MWGKKIVRRGIEVLLLLILLETTGIVEIPWLYIPPQMKFILVLFVLFSAVLLYEFIG